MSPRHASHCRLSLFLHTAHCIFRHAFLAHLSQLFWSFETPVSTVFPIYRLPVKPGSYPHKHIWKCIFDKIKQKQMTSSLPEPHHCTYHSFLLKHLGSSHLHTPDIFRVCLVRLLLLHTDSSKGGSDLFTPRHGDLPDHGSTLKT